MRDGGIVKVLQPVNGGGRIGEIFLRRIGRRVLRFGKLRHIFFHFFDRPFCTFAGGQIKSVMGALTQAGESRVTCGRAATACQGRRQGRKRGKGKGGAGWNGIYWQSVTAIQRGH
ncbi:hypothetical protein GCM10007291_20640 [Gemmobacter nanjingensis]|uniref:Uncharacterized protein n=1 Tax=Gemmobacter nanjingensis TaxID=488454 RepID=A0ABQ3FES4_9RHOB|nr:hypothetical protein GCM10007291_20640 [Gemmobacter nanjingensis]